MGATQLSWGNLAGIWARRIATVGSFFFFFFPAFSHCLLHVPDARACQGRNLQSDEVD